LIDYLKGRKITALFTAIDSGNPDDAEHAGVSSLMDSWIQVQILESNGERNRGLYIIKARGIAHSNQIREFILSDKGINLRDVYLGMEGVLTGSARTAQESREIEAEAERQQTIAVKKREMEHKRSHIETQIKALQAELESQTAEAELFVARQRAVSEAAAKAHKNIADIRGDKK